VRERTDGRLDLQGICGDTGGVDDRVVVLAPAHEPVS
jgi:hypothetical protein